MTKGNSSGQILIVAVLIIALLIISTQLYVYEFGGTIGEANPNSFANSIFAVRLNTQHVVIGSLANISRGGSNQTLSDNLQEWASFVGRQYQHGKLILNFTTRETTPYSSGIWISWGTNGLAVSGAYVNFTLRLSDRGPNVNTTHAVNITTAIRINGTYKALQGNDVQVNVTCNLLNEAKPALVENTTLYYKNETDWLPVNPQNNYTIMNYGNGTYFMSFVANIPSSNVEVSMHAYDYRGIYVQTSVTCTEI
ncbi:MAG: hypothetical protein JSV85_00905 [Candidatus Bathyarchaeota archaeon]|nr:MAG: hypothetical protein JSV85_00905 [Candidatus Bathyarchaeota archaeon]